MCVFFQKTKSRTRTELRREIEKKKQLEKETSEKMKFVGGGKRKRKKKERRGGRDTTSWWFSRFRCYLIFLCLFLNDTHIHRCSFISRLGRSRVLPSILFTCARYANYSKRKQRRSVKRNIKVTRKKKRNTFLEKKTISEVENRVVLLPLQFNAVG